MVRWWVLLLVMGCEAASPGLDGGSVDSGADSGVADAGPRDGGGAARDGGFCASCVASSDCGAGSWCLGGVEPRCGRDCTTTMQCAEGASCLGLGIGKSPKVGFQCAAAQTPSCGAFVRLALDCRDTFASYGATFFSTVCSGSCHRHDAQWPAVTDVRASADAIRLSVETGMMPTDQTLSVAERTRLLTWLACGAP